MGGVSPPKNSNTSDFGEILTIYVNLPEKNNRNNPNSLGAPVRELWGAEPPLKIQIHLILVKFRPYM